MRPCKQRLARHHRRKYPKLQETRDALRALRGYITRSTEYCEICGDELDEYSQCFTCSGPHGDMVALSRGENG